MTNEDEPKIGQTPVTARLFPYSVPSHDDRQLAVGSLLPLRDGGVPIFLAPEDDQPGLGQLVGKVEVQREENGWAVVDGYVRDDLLRPEVKASWVRGESLPVSFAVDHVTGEPADRPTQLITGARLRELRVSTTDTTVWDGAGIRAVEGPAAQG